MKLNFSFEIGKNKKEAEKNSELIGRMRSDGIFFDRTINGFFYPKDLFDRSNSNALISMYEDIPEIQAPINYIIDKMSIIDFYHVKKIGNREKIIDNSPVMEMLKHPNQYMKRADFIKAFFINKLVFGASFINRIKSLGFDEFTSLYILPSATTKVITSKVSKKDVRLNNIIGYKTDFGGGEINLDYKEVIVQYEANLSPEPEKIKSRLTSAIMASESLRYNYEARVKIYKDRGALGVLSPNDPTVTITKEQSEEVKRQYYKEHGLSGGKVPFMISSRSLNYTQIGLNVDELKLNENKLQDFQTVCNVLQVDPALFDNTKSTYNNKILAKKNFWEDVGMPGFNSFLELLQEVFNLPANERLIADYSNIPAMQEDFKTKVSANSTAYNDGAITQAEYRESIGYEGGENKFIGELQQSSSGSTAQSNNNGGSSGNTQTDESQTE